MTTGSSFDEQNKWGLPKTVEFCSRCVISNQRPSTVVEHEHAKTSRKPTIGFLDGICAACRYHEYKYHGIDWTERERQLRDLCDRFRSRNGSYDILVPGSGGKDSVYVAHILKHKYDMNPLTVTWAPHKYTDIGWKNLQSWIHAGFDNVLITPNGKVHSTLTRLAFEKLLHPFQPFIMGQKLVAPRLALEKGIKLVMYGESQAEGGSGLGWDDPRMPTSFFARPREKMLDIELGGVPFAELADMGLRHTDMQPYIPLDIAAVEAAKIEVHFMSYYGLWRPQDNFYYATEHCGFSPNPERSEGTYSKYSSLDDKIDGFHYFTIFVKFGIGRATYDAAQEVRNAHITREEAVALVHKYDGEFPKKYFAEFLDYIGIPEQRFWELIDAGRSSHLWQRTDEGWSLKHRVR